jgi:hypothetical protein
MPSGNILPGRPTECCLLRGLRAELKLVTVHCVTELCLLIAAALTVCASIRKKHTPHSTLHTPHDTRTLDSQAV